MEPHDITSYPLKLPFIRSSKMAKRDAIGTDFQPQEDERNTRPQSNDNFFRRSQAAQPRVCGRAPIEIQLANFRRKAIEMGFTGPGHPAYGSQPSPLPEDNSTLLRSDFYAAPPADLGPPLFPLARPSSRPAEEDFRWSDRFHLAPASQPCFPSGGRSNLDHSGAPLGFSLADEDSPPPLTRSQIPHRPFPLAGEPSAMFGALPHETGISQAALPPHCRWNTTPPPRRYRPRGDNRNQRNLLPSSRMFGATTASPPGLQTNFSFDTTHFASPGPPWKPTSDEARCDVGPLRAYPAGQKRRATSASRLPVKKQFKSGPATSPLDWDSDAEASPEHQSEPILDRGLLTLSPIAKSTPCLVPRPHSRSAGPPHDSSRATRRRYVQEKGVQTSKTLGVVVAGVDAAMQTDLSTNMPIFRESACSPLPWRPCPSCGCHRETAASSPSSVVSSPEEADPPVCRSASSGETETGSILTDFLIGVTREE